ncbi:MAG: glycoside hydrolase family 28 protein [Ferruginibacter sp.]
MKHRYTKFISFTVLAVLAFSLTAAAQEKDISYYLSKTPFAMQAVPVPKFNDKVFSITDYGAVADGKTLNTEAFAKAITACTKDGGGRVLVPAGTWLTGPVELKSNVDLHLEKGAVIQFTPDRTQYPIITMSGEGKNYVVASPLYAYRANNIAITGQGIIDGAGESWRPVKKSKVTAAMWDDLSKRGVISEDGKIWWPSAEAMNGEDYVKKLKRKTEPLTEKDYLPARDFLRPYMVYFIQCNTILMEGVTIRNSPKFVFYPNRCTDLTMNGVTVLNDWWAQNGDGIDISACKNVVIYKCTLSVGDDGICMKSSRGSKPEGDAELKNILIAQCTVYRAHGGFVIGSNTDGGMQNIYVADCNFIGSDIGIRVKSNPGRGGLVKDIYIDNIGMKNIKEEAILFTTYYEDMPAGKTSKDTSEREDGKIPRFTEFHISNVKCEGAATAVSIIGLKEVPVSKIYLENIDITAGKGFVSTDAENIYLKNVTLNTGKPLFSLKRSVNITLDGKQVE